MLSPHSPMIPIQKKQEYADRPASPVPNRKVYLESSSKALNS